MNIPDPAACHPVLNQFLELRFKDLSGNPFSFPAIKPAANRIYTILLLRLSSFRDWTGLDYLCAFAFKNTCI